VTDGPFAETKDLIAGWTVIDVDSYERAIQPGTDADNLLADTASRLNAQVSGPTSLERSR